MRILIIGSGGREHALAKALSKPQHVHELFAIGRNAGMQSLCSMADISMSDHAAIAAYALSQQIELAVVGPDEPLVNGLADAFRSHGIPCFGPSKEAARIEGSKAFSKAFMQRHHIPTPAYRVFSDCDQAYSYLVDCELPVVVKADGLALGKGVVIAFDRETAFKAVKQMMVDDQFGASGKTVVIEAYASGPEVSLLVFSDGVNAKAMVSAMDHKRAYDGDAGPNTGGMGAIAPNPWYTEEIAALCEKTIIEPTLQGLREEGIPFTGCLFFGLMLTQAGPVVIEYNCRFGDPETEAVLSLLQSDLADILVSCTNQTLDQVEVRFSSGYACSIALASGGYPLSYETGKQITIGRLVDGVEVLHAGTAIDESGNLVTSGGRVLHVIARADTLDSAVEQAYRAVDSISFAGMHYRKDIGKRALLKERGDGSSILGTTQTRISQC
ncbi:MAG: phosphoribosylamine--glycine ligase [Spirochaetota bacterium]|nr:phosphoribosylamine--glycine ligase [Spirochaetota bacterium]